MSDLRDYLLTVDKDKRASQEIVQRTAERLESKKLTLIEIVESLGEYINDEDTSIRAKAIQYLSEIIGTLPPSFLSRQQVQVLCQFFCDRIEDGGAVTGLTKLQSMAKFNREMAILTFRAILEHFQDLQLRPQSQRWSLLSLLNGLMSNHRPALQSLKEESLVGILDLVSGEKDPRNLMIIFSVLKVLMVEWEITNHAEALFDSVFCYFPITFRPPPDDPYGITAQDLKKRLRECIAASPYFAPFAFPQLLDRLDSTSPNVKKDVLQTITACAESYSVSTLSHYSTTLWDSLKYEVLNPQEEDLADEALVALTSLAIALSYGLSGADPRSPLATYLRPISKECNELLQEPQHKQAKPAGRIISSLGRASPIAFGLLMKAVLPPLFTLYQGAESIAKQRALLDVFLEILDSALSSYGKHHANPVIENPLAAFKDRLFEMLSVALLSTSKEEVSFRIVALKCLVCLCRLRNYLEYDELGMVVQYFDDVIMETDADDRPDLKDAATNGLVELSKIKAGLIIDITFPAFLARLPDLSTDKSSTDYVAVLEVLARVSIEKETSNTLIRRLFSRLDVVLNEPGPTAYPRAILSTLGHVLSGKDLKSDSALEFYYEKVVALITRVVSTTQSKDQSSALTDPATLEVLGRLSCIVIRALDTSKQALVSSQVYRLFRDEPISTIFPFGAKASDPQIPTMILSTYLLAGIDRTIPLPYRGLDFKQLIDELVRQSLSTQNTIMCRNILHQLALLVNKFTSSAELPWISEVLWAPRSGLLSEENLNDRSVRISFWIAKALVLRLAFVTEVLHSLLDLLVQPKYGDAAARGFRIILAPEPILSKETGSIVRLLANQKVFNICVSAIASRFPHADNAVKSRYLVAMSGILMYVPTKVLMSEVQELLPLLLQSLDLENQDVKAAALETLRIICLESPMAVEEHVSSLIARLISATAIPTGNSSTVRYNALRCLHSFPGKIKDSALLPYRKAVSRGITTVLDDPKRHIRKEAVDCKAAWANMDEVEEED